MRYVWMTLAALVVGCGPEKSAPPDAAPDEAPPAPVAGPRLTLERIYEDPPLYGVRIRGVKWSEDGSRVGYLRPGEHDRDVLELWAWEVDGGPPRRLVRTEDVVGGGDVELSEEEILALERKRITERGITSFHWAPDAGSVLLPLGGELYLFDLASAEPRVLDDGSRGVVLDPRFSPDGTMVAFVREGDLWVLDAEDGTQRRLTHGATETLTRGLAEFVAQEEMGRYRGYWWSPDSSSIAFLEVDTSDVEVWKRASYHAGESTMSEQRYPAAGRTNAAVRPGVVDVRSGRVRWLELAEDVEYVARVDWTPGGGTLALQLQPRDQRRLELVLVAPEAGEAEVLVTETSETFVNLHDDLTFLDDGRFLWSSERSGTRQIYLYDDGEPLQLTDGALPVLAVEGVDEGTGKVLYTAVTNRSLEAHLFAVPLEGGAPVQLTRKSGWHSVTVSEDGTHWVDTHSAAVQPPRSRVFDAAGERVAVLEANPTEELDALLDTGPEFTTVVAADGETELNASFIKPPSFDESEQHPLVVYGYGGPHGHVVADRWRRSSLFSHYLASRGYVVFSVDPRGSNHRGKRFEDAVHRSFGQVEVRDHAAAVEQVSDLPWVDPERIGIWGWSYGGYLAVMSLLSTEGVYRCGLAVAPVTNWHWYDTHYTERYLGMPDDEQVYDAASALERDPSGLTERLLVVHGMADDNVFLRHSLALIARLQEAGVQFETMLYPGKTHLIAGKNARKHLFTMMAGYWDRCLMEPPAP